MLTLIVLIVLPLQVIAFGVIGPLTRRRMQRAFLDYSRHQSRLVETLANVVTVKALGCEAVQSERLNRTLADSLLAGFEVTKLHIVNGNSRRIRGTLTEKTKEVRLDFFEALGMVTALMMDCDYKHWFVADISRNIIPALQAGQCKVYFDEEGRPNAFVTWALVDNDDHEALLREGCNPPPGKWASGNHLWFIDIVAPVGNILPRIKRDLHQNYFADHNKAYAIRRKADGAIRRVQVWKNPLVTRPTRSFRIGADIETHDD